MMVSFVFSSWQVQRYSKEKSEELLANDSSCKEYRFNFFFEKSEKDRLTHLDDVVIEDSGSEEEEGDLWLRNLVQ